MKIKPKKPLEPKNPEEQEDEEEEDNPMTQALQEINNDFRGLTSGKGFIQIGEITIGSHKGGLKACKNMATEILRDKNIKRYLGVFNKKKLLGSLPSYVD
jgi:hypothetical protein